MTSMMSQCDAELARRALRVGQAIQRANAIPLLKDYRHDIGRVRGWANLLRTCEAIIARGVMVSVEHTDALTHSWAIGEGDALGLTRRWRECERSPLPGVPLVVAFRGIGYTEWPAGLTPLPDHVAHVLISREALMACRARPYLARALANTVRESVRRLLDGDGQRVVSAVAAYEVDGAGVGFTESPSPATQTGRGLLE